MPLEPLFHPFRPAIEECFVSAKLDGGAAASAIALEIAEDPIGKGGARAEFMVFDPAGPIRITWNGIASLWAFSQGAARLSRRMSEAKRRNEQHLSMNADPEIRRGIDSFEFARRFCKQDVPLDKLKAEPWPRWAPPINPTPAVGSDDETGNRFFYGALGWILRHEIAHVVLKHSERQRSEGLTDHRCEAEADIEATVWIRGDLCCDPNRTAGEHPNASELQLEWRAICIGIGLVWIGLFEAARGRRSEKHPPVAERLAACLEVLGLREDSAAAEILFDVIQVWIDPEGKWAPTGGYQTARDALNDAVFRLHRKLMS